MMNDESQIKNADQEQFLSTSKPESRNVFKKFNINIMV